jgi:YD repeat-containing protein
MMSRRGRRRGGNSSTTYEYDASGNLTQISTDSDGDGTPDDIEAFEYNADGKLTQMSSDRDGDGTLDRITTYIYEEAPPLVGGEPATAFIGSDGALQGDVFFAGEAYAGKLFTNTDGSGNPNDVVLGTDGDDNIWTGLTGNDVIYSGEGNDTVGVSDGDTEIDTGSGDDVVYSTGDGAGTNTIDLGTGNNRLWLTGGDNTITAADGDDEIGLGDGTDSVEAGDGNNVIYMVDPNGTADGDKDILTGLGNDWVKTGSGDDRLDLGTNAGAAAGGYDIAFGQGGSDTFVLNAGDGWLTVGDFTQGEDVLEISGISFGDIGSSYNADRNSTWVWEKVGGDVLAELQGFSGSLAAGDFVSSGEVAA